LGGDQPCRFQAFRGFSKSATFVAPGLKYSFKLLLIANYHLSLINTFTEASAKAAGPKMAA